VRPEVAVVATERVPDHGPLGAEGAVMVCEPLPTAKDCWTWVAANQLVLPAWLKFKVQVPTVRNETTPPEIEHTAEDVASTVMATLRPEVAVALGV
jgi:hypothetical protein